MYGCVEVLFQVIPHVPSGMSDSHWYVLNLCLSGMNEIFSQEL